MLQNILVCISDLHLQSSVIYVAKIDDLLPLVASTQSSCVIVQEKEIVGAMAINLPCREIWILGDLY